jgi:hypothetical protein
MKNADFLRCARFVQSIYSCTYYQGQTERDIFKCFFMFLSTHQVLQYALLFMKIYLLLMSKFIVKYDGKCWFSSLRAILYKSIYSCTHYHGQTEKDIFKCFFYVFKYTSSHTICCVIFEIILIINVKIYN